MIFIGMKILPIYESTLNDENIQQLVDIIDNMDDSNPRREKYIQILKNKHNYNYIGGNDEGLIKNLNLSDIKTINDFRNFNNYKEYCVALFKKRNIPLNKSIGGVLNIEEVTELFKKFNIEVKEISPSNNNHAQASPGIIEIPRKASLEVVIHELGHIFDYINTNINANILSTRSTHTITTYGLSVGGEAFAENFTYYFLYPEFLIKYIPEVYQELDGLISNQWKILVHKLITLSNRG